MEAQGKVIAIPKSIEDIAPYWVQKVLQRDLPGVTISDVDVKGSICDGEGFMSEIVAFDARGTRDGKSQRYNLVAKMTKFTRPLATSNALEDDIQGHLNLERAEVGLYSVVVPELLSATTESSKKKAQDKDEGGHHPTDLFFVAKCYLAAADPSSMVSVRVLENLKTQGFSIKPDRQALSCDEMMLTVGALAQLHGLSHRLELRTGVPLSEKYDFLVKYTMNADQTVALYQNPLKEVLAAFPDQTDLVARLEKIDVQSVLVGVLKSPRVKVLNHGDCWINNIMFKYKGDVPTEVKLVDWQGFTYFPPTYDLALLFLCSADWDVFHMHRDAILAHYHQQLHSTMEQNDPSGLQSYTLEQLKADFRADCLYGIISRVMRMAILRPDLDFLQMVQEIKEWGVL
ncbi:PREDICTED: uncharacterized protein LOC109462205 [Branchiostoma belcheri]|uniref:Uncharacterized protein LOC109462205 n=1 Tax=Branchiostoma belcheri TaxID=7741 RepID=A0A6P4XQC2_BRABE|nr:PREDICTED: uncharacterized protein LOC109462205 [Branchiostoma belcheri]